MWGKHPHFTTMKEGPQTYSREDEHENLDLCRQPF